jgi:hypothetical protein
MRPFPLLASSGLLCVVFLPLVTPSCGGSTSTPPTVTGGAGSTQQGGGAGTAVTSTDTCATNDECAWGEISKEILSAGDCPCLYGCPYLPQTKVTATRRGEQFKALCNPRMSGNGNQCGIDDCALPGAIACLDGACKAAPRDGGMGQ